MKQKKRSGLSRIGALLLVIILAINLVVPCFAAGGVVLDDTKAIETGILKYDYDKIPAHMLEDNYALDALEYIGYDVQALKDNKLLYHPDYIGIHLLSNQYLLQEDPILTYIPYRDNGPYGSSSKKAETAEEIAASQTGRVPDIQAFYKGKGDKKPGMSCTSFVEYFVFGYMKHIVGKDTRYIEDMHTTAQERMANGTNTYPDTWTEMCEGKNGLISQGKVNHYSIDLDSSKDQTAEYNAIWRKISPGTIIRFGNDTSPYIHYAVYIGTYNNLHYVAQVAGGDRGPEIFVAEEMAYRNEAKNSYPIDFYDFKFKNPYGAIQVVKVDANDGTTLAGAYFKVVNQSTQEVFTLGPTNEKGYAIVDYLPYNATAGTKYTVQEVIAPEGYALDPTVHTVTLSLDTPLVTLEREIVNTKAFGSLQIQKETNTGNNKFGWQFNIYKNQPFYSTALTLENSGQMFRVTVSDSKGNSVTSDTVSMTTTPLKILRQPASVKVALNEVARFNVTVQGDGLTYKWYYQNPGEEVSEAGSTAGMYSPYYNYTIKETNKSGRAMWCVITDKYGNTVTSNKAYLWLDTDPNAPSTIEAPASLITYGDTTSSGSAVPASADTLAITRQPQNHIDEDGTTAIFTVEAQGVGLTYVWETSTDGGETWTRLTNPVNPTPLATNANGIYTVSKLQIGNYFVQEIDTGKEGWEYDLIAKPVTVTANHTTAAPAVVEFTNNELTGNLLIKKTTEDKKNVGGWKFAIYANKACTALVAGPYTTDAAGNLLVESLPAGVYWVKELGHSDSAIDELYYCASENPQQVEIVAGVTRNVQFANNLKKGNGQIIKIPTNGGIKEGWQFHVWSDSKDFGIYTTDVNGEINELNQLLPGTYYVQEVGHASLTSAELEYWVMDTETKTLVIEANKTNSVTFNNQWLGKGQISKETPTGGTKEGWQFHVWNDAKDFGIHTTDKNGNIDLGLMQPGQYYIQEVGHATMTQEELKLWFMDTGRKILTIKAGQTATVRVENRYGGRFALNKIMSDGSSAEGWRFDIQDSQGNVTTHYTDEYGKINLVLLPGTYTVTEVIPANMMYEPMGGIMSFEIEIKAGEIVVKSVTNVPIRGDISINKTDGNGNPVSNAGFVAIGSNGKEYNFIESNTTPGLYVLTDIPIDQYIVTETVVPPGFQVGEDNEWLVSLTKTHRSETLDIVNAPNVGSLVIQKETNTGKNLDGWKVNVYKDFVAPENLLPGSPFETDEEGKIVIEGLNAGVYVAVEVDDGKDLWIYDLEEKVVEVPRNDVGTVTIKNVQLGVGQIVKETTNGGSKAGWKFEVRDANNKLIGTYTTGETGIITLNLEPGTYTVTELSGGDGYWVADPQSTKTLTVVAGKTRSVKFLNKWLGKGQIIKETTNGGSKAGWTFEVRDANNKVVGTYTTGESGIITMNLEPGTYTVTEISGGDDYWVADPQPTKTLVVAAGQTSKVEFLNRWLGKGQIIKETTNGGSKAGWTFEVRDAAGTLIGTYTTGETGIITMNLNPGTYSVTELSGEDGYWVADPQSTKTLVVTAGQTSSVKFLNKWLGKGQIIKETTNGGSKAGWKFEVRDTAGTLVGTYITDETGIITLNLEPGTYNVTEIPVGNDYWVADSQITKTLTVVAGQTRSVKFLNHWIGKGQIIKETTNGGSKAGWKFEVRDAAGTLIGTYTTGETGIITMNLNPGTYSVTELSGEDGYWVADPQSTKTLVVTAGQTSSVKFLNKWLGKGQIIKETTNGGSKAGWTFEVRGEQNELIGTYTTDETGIISLNLEPGSYLVIEVSGGDDYWEADPDAIQILDVVAGQTSKVEFLNRWLGIGKIVKETTNGGSKAGWVFEVRDAEGALVGTYTTDETGIITMKLNPGTYSVTELSGEDGYWVADPQSTKTLVVTAGQTSSVKFLNKWLGKGQIIKETTNGGSKAGWKFEVRDEAGTLVGTYTTDESGIINLDLAPGIYSVTEISGGDDYWVADAQSTKTLLVTAGQTSSVKFLNKWLGKGQIIKETTNGGSKAGWIFEVLDANGGLVGVYTTDETGIITLNLNPGTYSVTEIAGGDSYWVSDSQATKTLVVVAGQTSSVKYLNNWIGKGQIVKETTNNGSKAGWQFEIRDESGALIGTYTTDETGIITLSLVPGTYTVTEIAGGDTYWVADPQATKTLVVVAGQTSSVQFLNNWIGKGQIIKEMADGSSPAGWKFEVLDANGKPIPGSPFMTDAEGKIALDGLEPGVYTVRELIPDGSLYECVGSVQQILTITAGQTASVRYVNALRSGSISIEKVDGNGRHLAGAKFLLEWSDDGGMTWTAVTLTNSPDPILGGCRTADLVDGCLITGEDGVIRFEGLYPGLMYRVTEVKAPNGYMLLADHAYIGELTAENLAVELVVRNDAVIEMPMTGISSDNGTFLRVAFGVFCVTFVIMGIAIVKSRITSIPD